MSLKKYKQIQIRIASNEEIEIVNRFKAYCKNRKESFNNILKNMLIESMQNTLHNKELNKNQSFLKEVLDNSLDQSIIPRISQMVLTANKQNIIKTELINRKLNFVIDELGRKRIIDGKPVVTDINFKTKEKNWMLEEQIKIAEEIEIKNH